MEKTNILIVEDEEVNREMLSELVKGVGHNPITATNGREGLEQLHAQENIKGILLDWIMPEMDGLELLKIIKKKDAFSDIPVIMQTSKRDKKSILEGISHGAYYYLTKPYETEILLAVLRAAIEEYEKGLELKRKISEYEMNIDDFITQGNLQFRTIDDGKKIATWFGKFSVNQFTAPGLLELFINAIEHGNLGITYDEKTKFMKANILVEEIERRLELPENIDKVVEVRFKRNIGNMDVDIIDQGDGFEYTKYLDFNPERVFDPNGRGIALANNNYFNGITYSGKGNEVSVEFILK